MSFTSFFLRQKQKSATVAKERLQIILAHERVGRRLGEHDYLPDLQRDLMEVIGKYVKIELSDVTVNLDRRVDLDVLEVKIELPEKVDIPSEV
jgi:cell division topological specificity factor